VLRIRDPVDTFLTLGSSIHGIQGKKSEGENREKIGDYVSKSSVKRFGLKTLKFFVADLDPISFAFLILDLG
jgi:hypothetical protein